MLVLTRRVDEGITITKDEKKLAIIVFNVSNRNIHFRMDTLEKDIEVEFVESDYENIFTRKIGEFLDVFWDGVKITISFIKIKGGKSVMIGIDAPNTFHVLRNEVKSKEVQENAIG